MTNTATLTLTDFLLARIAEDEATARGHEGTAYQSWTYVPHTHALGGAVVPGPLADDWNSGGYVPVSAHIARHDPARVLAECEAKRRVVTLMGYVRESWDNSGEGRVMWSDVTRREKSHALTILETLAAVYSTHPEYRPEWSA